MVRTLFHQKETYQLISSTFTVLSIIKAFFKESFHRTYPYIQSPILLIYATLPKDLNEARSKGIRELKQHIENVTIVPIDEAGHMVHWDSPKKVADSIKHWSKKSDS